MPELHPNVTTVNRLLAEAGLASQVRVLPDAAPTAAAAAEQIGCPVGAIANSLIFATAEGAPLLVLTSGAHRVDTAKVAALVGTSALKRATPEFVRSVTGQVIGGVAPVGHPAPIRTLIDRDLAAYEQIWAAGGIAHAVFAVTFDELRELTSAQVAEVA